MELKTLDFGELEARLSADLEKVKDKESLEHVRRTWLAKEGIVKVLFQQLRDVEPDKKPEMAAKLNTIKERIGSFVKEKEASLTESSRAKKLESEFMDLSLPGEFPGVGRIHPITYVERKFTSILRPFGFFNQLGPEIELEYYNFDALNIPKHHPARDMQDTFFTDPGEVLRTHTSSVQVRALKKGGLPIKIACMGRCYRNETEDASHTSILHQYDIIWVEEGLTLSHLMGLIVHILKGLYGKRRKVRFVPKYYPYTEPSIGPQINCVICGGKGCSSCDGAGWVTVAGAGMVHRNVLLECNYDPSKVTGFAFGMGTSRLASQFCGISSLRSLYSNDLRILRGAQ